MAPLPTISDTYRVNLQWANTDTSRQANNVIHVRASGASPLSVATAIDTCVAAQMWQFQNADSRVVQMNVTPLDGSGVTLPVIIPSAAKWTGFQTGGDMNPATCNIVKLVTGKRGRSYRGRVYLPWVTDGVQTNGILNSSALAGAQTAWVAFHTALTAAGFDWVVASYKLETADDVVGVLCESHTATQRRRNKRTSS